MTEDGKLHNPLPEPIQGRREEPDFPIQDVSAADWNTDSRRQAESALKPIRTEDDFDVAISEDDDFDL